MATAQQLGAARLTALGSTDPNVAPRFVVAWFVDLGGGLVFDETAAGSGQVRYYTLAEVQAVGLRSLQCAEDTHIARANDAWGNIDYPRIAAIVGVGQANRFILPYLVAQQLGVL